MSGKAIGAIRAAGVFRVCKAREAPRNAARGDGMLLHQSGARRSPNGNRGLLFEMRPICREAFGHRQVFRPRRKAALRLRILGRNTTHHTCINLYVRPENTTGAKGRFYRASLLLGPVGTAGGDAFGRFVALPVGLWGLLACRANLVKKAGARGIDCPRSFPASTPCLSGQVPCDAGFYPFFGLFFGGLRAINANAPLTPLHA